MTDPLPPDRIQGNVIRRMNPWPFLAAATAIWSGGPAVAQQQPWDLPPVSYSGTTPTDAITRLGQRLAAGTATLEGRTDLDKLRVILRLLDVPEESQVLVFSKTSHQNPLIRPGNPRSLYFNENAYVGHVPGGDIEIAITDPVLGTVFHLIDTRQPDPARIVARDTSVCLSCHATGRTEGVPGVLIRSVHPDAAGQLLLHLGTELIDARSPIPVRWGGYYVTGSSSLPHLGNRVFRDDEVPDDGETPQHRTLHGIIPVEKYLRPTSDIVSLMVLEHQCRVHNLLVAASMEYRRIAWFRNSIPGAPAEDDGRLEKAAASMAGKITDALLFRDEADIGGGVEGDQAFQDTFTRRFPRTADGDSLADFQLSSRLFKNRCSYMVYSDPFAALPAPVKAAVLRRLRAVIEEGNDFPGIKPSERARISSILRQTLPGYLQ